MGETVNQRRQHALYERLTTALPRGNRSGMVYLGDVTKALGKVSTEMFTHLNEDREALEIENALRAYLELASRRFIDVVPMKLTYVLLDSYMTEMESALLGAATDEKVAELLRESANKAAHRQELLDEVAMFQKGTQIIEMSEFN